MPKDNQAIIAFRCLPSMSKRLNAVARYRSKKSGIKLTPGAIAREAVLAAIVNAEKEMSK